MKTVSYYFRKNRLAKLFAFVSRKILYNHLMIRDLKNYFKFGKLGPRFNEVVLVNSREVYFKLSEEIKQFFFLRCVSGKVVDFDYLLGNAPLLLTQIHSNLKFVACYEHFVYGKEWDETLLFEHYKTKQKSGLKLDGNLDSFEDLRRRYAQLDLIFKEVIELNRFKMPFQLQKKSKRGAGLPTIHIARDGSLLFGGGGHHRFAIAHILNIPLPMKVGLVHPQALEYFANLKKDYLQYISKIVI